MFEAIDTSVTDKRLDPDEFRKAVPLIEEWGSRDSSRPPLKIDDATSEFQSIDVDGDGTLTFDEFAKWAFQKRLELDDSTENLVSGNQSDGEGAKTKARGRHYVREDQRICAPAPRACMSTQRRDDYGGTAT